MYTLRKIIDGVQHNEEIGKSYQVIDRDCNYEKFREAFKTFFQSDHVADLDSESNNFTKNCCIILVIKEGKEMIPLYKDQLNYIMTENGKTFSNLSVK